MILSTTNLIAVLPNSDITEALFPSVTIQHTWVLCSCFTTFITKLPTASALSSPIDHVTINIADYKTVVAI